jgi:hypothetical protein
VLHRQVWTWGEPWGDFSFRVEREPRPVGGVTGMAAIACGAFHNMALSTEGQVREEEREREREGGLQGRAAIPACLSDAERGFRSRPSGNRHGGDRDRVRGVPQHGTLD